MIESPQPTVDDLAEWTRRGLEDGFQRRQRAQCSREDFTSGFIAALVFLRSTSSFRQRGSTEAHAAEMAKGRRVAGKP